MERNQELKHYENGGKFGIEINDFDNYVVFVLGRDYLKDILPYENDIASMNVSFLMKEMSLF